jgi:hypothetical protein
VDSPSRTPSRGLLARLRSRRGLALAGAAAAVVAGLAAAAWMISRDDAPDEAPPASQGGLQVQTGRDDDIKLDPGRPLKCYVNGQIVGQMTVADCAKRNGVATGALDVGLDRNGALAGTNGATADITPLPPDAVSSSAPIDENAGGAAVDSEGVAAAPPPATAPCWRYGDTEWTRLPQDVSLQACVQSLFGGMCRSAASPVFGRWADRALRLNEGRVELAPDGRTFETLFARPPGCPVPPTG